MKDDDNKTISSDEAIELGHDFLVHRQQLLKERIAKTDGEELAEKVTGGIFFEFRNIADRQEFWTITFHAELLSGTIDPPIRIVSVHKTTGEVIFGVFE